MHLRQTHSFCSRRLTNCLNFPNFLKQRKPLRSLPRAPVMAFSPPFRGYSDFTSKENEKVGKKYVAFNSLASVSLPWFSLL